MITKDVCFQLPVPYLVLLFFLSQIEENSSLENMLIENHNSLMEEMNSWNFQIFDLVQKMGDKSRRILSQVCCYCRNSVYFI